MDLKSNEPFWLLKNGLIHNYPSLQNDINCDVLVVGGGITGSLVAHQCVEDGYKTVIIDRRELAHGSTSATTSMLQYEIDTPLHELKTMIGHEAAIKCYNSCADAIDKLKDITNSIRSKSGFKTKKSLYFAAQNKHVPMLKQEYEARRGAGFQVDWLDKNDIKNHFGIHNTFGGILSQKGGSMDAFMLAHELIHHNTKRGLQVYDKTELTKVENLQGAVICHLKNQNVITSKKIIYCTGYESVKLIKEKFINLISTYALVSEVDEVTFEDLRDLLIWNTNDPYYYQRMTREGRILIGGEDEEFRHPSRRDALISKKEKKLENYFSKLFPDKPMVVDFSWAGTFGTTKDGLPYIGTHSDHPNAYFVLGFGGNGITFSVTGMEMVSLWLQNKAHELSPYFAFGR